MFCEGSRCGISTFATVVAYLRRDRHASLHPVGSASTQCDGCHAVTIA
ncbi:MULTISPECIES: hypothetical protein [Dickeya]|uniref:Uncharacterized protein n=1 Tax=Dickeya oryzae TaxID=1240404 RepID=A0AB39IT27_9GAMM|nr:MULTISPECIES: hypothetical protein [Dickeya]MBP2850730.1 hypothetical protein [Dickeya oryzae]MBP2858586.1 hypothetical protein [Dickeya oryzae]MCA6990312.1 hypothetical protein [Dickeya oryzae]